MTTSPAATDFLDTAEMAALVRTTPATARWWRHVGRGPAFLKPPGTRKALYRRSDILRWLEAGETEPGAVSRQPR